MFWTSPVSSRRQTSDSVACGAGRDGQIKADFDRQPIRNFTPADGGRQTYSYEGEGRTPIQYTGDRIQSAQYTGERVNTYTEPGRYDVTSTSGKRMTYTGGYLAQSEEDYHRYLNADEKHLDAYFLPIAHILCSCPCSTLPLKSHPVVYFSG